MKLVGFLPLDAYAVHHQLSMQLQLLLHTDGFSANDLAILGVLCVTGHEEDNRNLAKQHLYSL